MKKLLVLTLVLAMASLAGAGLQLGNAAGIVLQDSEVILHESDILELTVVAEGGQLANLGAVIGVLVNGPGTIYAGPDVYNNVTEDIFDLDEETAAAFGMSTAIFADMAIPQGTGYPPIPDGIAAGGILFHCAGLGDVIIQIVDLDRGTIMDELIIHQIPEPASLLLLGLGGLFLRRK